MSRAFAALLLLLSAGRAHAFVRAQTSTGTPVDWNGHCAQLEIGGPANPTVPTEQLRAALERSADAWNVPTRSCANPRVAIEAALAKASDVGFDGTNVVLWRLPGFCDGGAHQQDDVCTSPNAAAVTTIFYVDKPGDARDGQLLETDMELNAVTFAFADDGSPNKVDLGNTLTHEIGHVLGLDHTCYTVPGSAPRRDSTGAPVPHCFPLSALPPSVTQATMFNFEVPGEVDKRAPTHEETEAICSIYAGHAAACASGGGCAIAASTRVVPLGVIALALALSLFAWLHAPRRTP